jgi:ABC-type Zn uptake system ZnuABC Zn-binding protein ZnuA
MSLDINENKEKAIKELELIAKKIKKRMSLLDNSETITNNSSFIELSKEYRGIKETIIRIIQM